jgi:hypothetical protein
MKAAKVRAAFESILINQDYSVLKNLLTQKDRASLDLNEIHWSWQFLK